MGFFTEMRDLLPKEKPLAHDDTLEWYLEDLFLAYKYNYKENFFRDISALKPYLSEQVYRMLIYIGEHRHHW